MKQQIDVDDIPYGVLIAAEKMLGRGIQAIALKQPKTFEDIRDLAFFNLYVQDQSVTIAKLNTMSTNQIKQASGMTEEEIKAEKAEAVAKMVTEAKDAAAPAV